MIGRSDCISVLWSLDEFYSLCFFSSRPRGTGGAAGSLAASAGSGGGGGEGGLLDLLLLAAGHDLGAGAVVAEGEASAAGQALGVGRGGAEDGQADAADEARVDDAAVAEAGGAEVDAVLRRAHQVLARGRVRATAAAWCDMSSIVTCRVSS